jgi:hypothetical protein
VQYFEEKHEHPFGRAASSIVSKRNIGREHAQQPGQQRQHFTPYGIHAAR